MPEQFCVIPGRAKGASPESIATSTLTAVAMDSGPRSLRLLGRNDAMVARA
jgi:hypothetical protein